MPDAPLTRRADLLREQLAHLPLGRRALSDGSLPTRVGVTGTGDDLLVLAWSPADLAREVAAGARVLRRLGIAPAMRVANTLPGALATPGALLLGDVVEEIGGLDVPLGVIDSDASARAAWELIDRVRVEVLVLDDSSGPRLLAAMPAGDRPWWRGIVWRRIGASTAAPGFSGWQRSWLAVPEVTSFVAHSCANGRHHVDEGIVAEVVDGALLLARPPLRYITDVRATAVSCPCGAAGVALELP